MSTQPGPQLFARLTTLRKPLSSIMIIVGSNPTRFVFVLRTSYYALQVKPSGEVLHVGSGPLPLPGAGAALFEDLGAYEEANFVWDGQGTRFELPAFGDVSYHTVLLKAAFAEPAGELRPGEARNLPVRDLRLRYHSHCIQDNATPGLAPAHVPAVRGEARRETLALRLKDEAYAFYATLYYRLTPEHDVIERWIELENGTGSPVEIETLGFGSLHLPHGEYEVTRPAGAWAREFVANRQRLEQGSFVLSQLGLNTGHASNPFFLLNSCGAAIEEAGIVYFGALAYSGNWSLEFEVLPTGPVRVHGGYERTDFALTLAPGERHATPAFVHGCCAEGWGGASRRLHRFVRDYVMPNGEASRPVLYNSWEATYFDLSIDGQIHLARLAASIGVELFVVDDGWFGGRRHDRAGLGDWVVSRDVFPQGLKPLIDEVRRLGMAFGLWVEPEMVNPDSDLYRAHPDWVLHFPGRPRTESRTQLVLDFGRPEVVEHIFGVLDALCRENEIDFIKWDMNRYATEPGSPAGKALWRRHVAGVYRIMDGLRERHPRLSIQSCSGGGGRIDLGVLARSDQVWTSDNTDACDRVGIQNGFSLAYPPRVMESWVTHEVNHQTGRRWPLDLRFDVAMRGVLGIGSSLNQLSPEELKVYARKIAFYKKIRPVVQHGDLYRLSAAPSTWQSVLPDASRAVYSIVVLQHRLGVHRAPARLRGLSNDAHYRITDENGAVVGRSRGFQLMTLGLPGDTVFGGLGCSLRSRTLLLERE
ncbi:MAG TPA: alpha-galactosidase [Opitutaceae bacterium]